MADINVGVKWSDNTPELTRNLATGLTQVDATQKSIDKLVTSLSGQTQIQAANRWAAALQTLGGQAGALAGIQGLTATETDKATSAINNAIAKYQALGATAPKALTDIADALKQKTNPELSAFGKYLDDLKPKVDNAHASFTSMKSTLSEMWDSPTAGAQKLASAVGSDLATGMGSAGVAIGLVSAAAVVAGVAVFDLAERAAAVGSNLEDLHNKSGLSVDGLSRLSYAATVAGASVDQIANAMFMFEKQAGNDAPKVAQGMELIGLSLDEIKKLAPEDQFTAIASALAKTGDVTVRNAAGNDIFGRSFRDLAPLIMKMNDALALTADLNPWTEEEAKLAEEFEMHLASIHVHFDAIGTTLGRSVLPSVERFVAALDEIAHWTPPSWMEHGLSLGMVEQGQRPGQMQAPPTRAELAGGVPDNLPQTFLQRGGAPNVLPLAGGVTLPPNPLLDPSEAQVTAAQMDKFNEQINKEAQEAQKKYVEQWQKTDDEIQKIWGEAFVAGAAIDTKSLAGQLAVLDQKRVNEENAATERIAETTKSEEQLGQLVAAIRLKYANLDNAAIQAATEKNIEDSEAAGLAGAAAVSKAFAGPQLVLKNLLVSMGAVPISLKSILTPTQEMGTLMTDVTVTAKEHFDELHDAITGDVTNIVATMSAMGVKTRDDLQRTADQFKADYDAMLASGQFTTQELTAAWLRYKQAVAAAHPEAVIAAEDMGRLASGIGAINTALAPIANLSPSFSLVSKAVGGVTTGIQGMSKAMADVAANGMNAGNLASIAEEYIAIGTAMYSVIQGLEAQEKQEEALLRLANQNSFLQQVFGGTADYSAQLQSSLADVVDELNKVYTTAGLTGRAIRDSLFTNWERAQAMDSAQIIDELGGLSNMTADQISLIETRTGALFEMIQQGGRLAAQSTKALDDELMEFANNTDSYGRVNQFFTDMVEQAREAGIVLPQVAAFFTQQAANAASGLSDLLGQDMITHVQDLGKAVDDAQAAYDKLRASGTATASQLTTAQNTLTDALTAAHAAGVADKQALDNLAETALTTFNTAIASGETSVQALQSIAPQLETITKAYKDLGLTIDDTAVKGLLLENTLLNGTADNPSGLGKAISGLQAIVTAAMNFGPGVETKAAVQGQEGSLAGLYTQAQAASAAQGVTGDQGTVSALLPFQATLHEMQDWANQNKVELDDSTKQMIAQSQELGIWNDDFKSDSEKTRDSLADVVKSADALATALGGLPDALAAVLAGHASIPEPPSPPPSTVPPGPPVAIPRVPPHASTGGFVTDYGISKYLVSGGPVGSDTVNAYLTPGESVLTKTATSAIGIPTIAALNAGMFGITDPGQGPGKYGIGAGMGWSDTDPTAQPPIWGPIDTGGGGSIGTPWTPPTSSWVPPPVWTDIGKAPTVSVGGSGGPGSPAGGGNVYHITIQTIDGPSVQRFVRSQEFADALVSSTTFNKNSMRTGMRAGLGVS